MKLLDYAWDTVTSISQRDYNDLRLILDEKLISPVLTNDKRGWLIKLPVPRTDEAESFSLHGLKCESNEHNWEMLWRIFKASLYHVALHSAYSDFRKYASWARGKELNTATYCVSLVEDLLVTFRAAKRWPGLLEDIAYANYISSLRVQDVEVSNPADRLASKMLLASWGVSGPKRERSEEDEEIDAVVKAVRAILGESASKKRGEDREAVEKAAQSIYSAISRKGRLQEVPTMPYMESHGPSSLFAGRIQTTPASTTDEPLRSARVAVGMKPDGALDNKTSRNEALEMYQSFVDSRQKLAKIMEKYERVAATTRLDSVEFPPADYGTYLRVKSDLSGPIRNIRDQLRLIKNILDENPGYESGQLETQAAIQVIASGKMRTDVFVREDPMVKDEAWAILLDASKSVSSFSHELKGMATCLSEVANELIPRRAQWAAFSFNNTLQIIKDFDEEYSTETKARIGGLEMRNVTLLPDAMITCNKVLNSTGVDLRILLVVSDGYPVGYNDIGKKLVSTIKEIAKSGTLLIGVGVDSQAIRDYFTVHCVIESPYQLMKSFVKSYLELSSLF